jgi:hypothetical protein
MLITRMMRGLARPERLRFLALYDMNRVTDAGRAAFLAKVKREMEAF